MIKIFQIIFQPIDRLMSKNFTIFGVSDAIKISNCAKMCLVLFLPIKYKRMFTSFTNFSFKDSSEEVGCEKHQSGC